MSFLCDNLGIYTLSFLQMQDIQWRIQHRAYPAYAPLLGENIAFSCIFWYKVKLTSLFSVKMWLTPPPLAHSGSATDIERHLHVYIAADK